jgi:hypothetical protein
MKVYATGLAAFPIVPDPDFQAKRKAKATIGGTMK